MARMARVVVPHCPHYVTQRGNRPQRTFLGDDHYVTYLELSSEFCRKADTRVWACCLMPNHVYLVMVPSRDYGLRASLGKAHRQYTRAINFRKQWRGHLWQERFHSFPMDEANLLATVRYVERNPVAARLCSHPEDWLWSSAAAHLRGQNDALVDVQPMLARADDWAAYLSDTSHEGIGLCISKNSRTGRPLGDARFVHTLERITGRMLTHRPPGRKKKPEEK